MGDTPKKLRDDITKSRAAQPLAAKLAAPALNRAPTISGPVRPAGGTVDNSGLVLPSFYQQATDNTQVQPASNTTPAGNGGLLLPGSANAVNPNFAAMPPLPAGPATTPGLQRAETLPPGIPSPAAPNLNQGMTMPAQATSPATSKAMELLNQGEQALQAGQTEQALKAFREAYANQNELSDIARSRLQDHMRLLSRPAQPAATAPSNIQTAESTQQIQAKQLSAEVNRVQSQARELMTKDPKKAIEMLDEAKTKYAAATIDQPTKDLIQKRLELTRADIQKFLTINKAQIELDEKNDAVRADIARDMDQKQAIDDKLVRMVEEFNRLQDEQRFAEAEVVAKRAHEMAPKNLVTSQMLHTAKMARRWNQIQEIKSLREDGNQFALVETERALIIPKVDFSFPDRPTWDKLTSTRSKNLNESSFRTVREREIDKRLMTPVKISTRTDLQRPGGKKPLRDVLDTLEKMTDINMHIDEAGLAEVQVDSNVMVEVHLNQEIPLKSLLKIVLDEYRLAYVIKNDVLTITSAERTKGLVYAKSYSVADLVIPIPNFVPNGNMGLSGALYQGYQMTAAGRGAASGYMPTLNAMPVNVAATPDGGTTNAKMLPQLAQQQALNNPAFARNGFNNGPPATGMMQQPAFGPGGMGGGAQADFDSLINLITSTVQPTTWKQNGGQGDVAPFETNLTLVVSTTQEVHEQLADLLQQLRRLQDLQVTIEVRFITLSDNFFERIGMDFDFAIDDNVTNVQFNSDQGPSSVVGLTNASQGPANPSFTPNFNLQYNNGLVGDATVPAFPGIGFNPATAGTFGFAILSDIEAYFLITAAQGDTRNNILQAPKVTLFNGQSAFISDTSQRPFVTSVIPVVGDFAAAQQPVIVVLSEGTSLTVQAVVSNDRRFVRLTVVPFFSQIGDVEEFTFTGSKTSTSKESSSTTSSGTASGKDAAKDTTTVSEGTTVQLPTFAFVTVTTTVSVPDGGTVLLGGIKRLSEGRNERGIPILSKIPYINRLFKTLVSDAPHKA